MSLDFPFMDITSEAWRTEPDKVLEEMRQKSPIVKTQEGYELLTYDLCEQVMRDDKWRNATTLMLAKLEAQGMKFERSEGLHLLSSEGTDHDRARRAVQPWFNIRRAQDMRDRTRDAVLDLMGPGTARGTCEFLSEIGERLPARVFCWMVGARDEDAEEIKRMSLTIMKIFNGTKEDLAQVQSGLRDLTHFIKRLVEVKRTKPADDLTSYLIKAVGEGLIAECDVASLTQEVLGASAENTAQMAALMLWALCQRPDELARVRKDPSLIPTAVEECMRLAPRIRRDPFYNSEECTFAGHVFPANTLLFASFAAANRDPAVYADPQKFDVSRKHPRPQLIFGVGRHHCLGASLVRMELQEVLRAVLDSWKDIAIDGPVKINHAGAMTISRLPLKFAA